MNAGALFYLLKMYDKESEVSPSGHRKERDVLLFSCRAWIKKFRPMYDKDGLMAREEFQGQTIVFQVRYQKKLKKAKELEFDGTRYLIIMQVPQVDRTVLVYCRELDK